MRTRPKTVRPVDSTIRTSRSFATLYPGSACASMGTSSKVTKTSCDRLQMTVCGVASLCTSKGKNTPSALRRSAMRSGPANVARKPERKKHPLMVAPMVSVNSASARRFSIRNSDTSSDISARQVHLDIYSEYSAAGESAMGFTPTETIWFNGQLVPWGEAKVHVLAHALQYGTGVFEGMRSYETADGPAIFRLDAHLERFFKSAQLYDLTIPYSQDRLAEA